MTRHTIAVRLDAIPGDIRKPGGLQRSLQRASDLGARGVELCARTAIRPAELSDSALRQLRKMMDDLNLRVSSVRFQTRRGYDNPADLDRRVEATKDAMKLAYRLGAGCVVNQIGLVPDLTDDEMATLGADAHEQSAEARRWSGLRAVLDDLGRYGAHVGAFLAAETGTESGPTLAKLLDLESDAYVAVCLNPGQLIINRQNVAEAINALGERIQCVAAVDGVLDLAAGRGVAVPLGQGTADLPAMLGQLEDTQYAGPLVVGRSGMDEQSAWTELQDSVAYLNTLLPGQ